MKTVAIEIQLTKRYVTVVDDEDADLATVKWQAQVRSRRNVYGRRSIKTASGTAPQLMHRVILARALGRPLAPHEQVDHIDGNGLNNRRENLRIATAAQNQRNAKLRIDNTSGYKGVYFDKRKKKWRGLIKFNQKTIHLGSYATPEAAHEAYCKAAKELFGEFANDGTN